MLTLGKENGQAQLTNKHRRGAHTDSFKTHGLDYSDFFLLLFAQASGLGGENFAVDGYRTVAALAAHPVTGPLVAKLAVRKTASFFEFSLYLSRACLGKMIVLMYKWLNNAVFRRRSRCGNRKDDFGAILY